RDRAIARAIVHERQAAGELEGSHDEGGGAVTRSYSQKVSDLRYASLKRYLAKRFHPDYAPGQGIEKIVRNEIFKEIWHEIERLDRGVSATRFATAQSSTAA